MKVKKFNAVELKRKLQRDSEKKLSKLPEKEQLGLLAKKFGHLKKSKRVAQVA
jgi:hypothetical protein